MKMGGGDDDPLVHAGAGRWTNLEAWMAMRIRDGGLIF